MSRDSHPFYAPPSAIAGGRVRFPKEEARHILRVTRLGPGDRIRVVDGEGGVLGVVLEEADETGLAGRVVDHDRIPPPQVPLELGFPLLRQRARTEWMLEKAVEVGADRLIPVAWERALPKGRALPAAVRARWERILREAMKQCERAWLPPLDEPAAPAACEARTQLLLADPAGGADAPVTRDGGPVRLLVGPEGGLTAAEKQALLDRGARLWSLGPTRLRAETAAIVGIARLSAAIGKQGQPGP